MSRNSAARNAVQRSGDHVTVGLKLPNGLVLRLQKQETVRYPKRDGDMMEIQEWHPDHEAPTYTLHGNRFPHGSQPRCLIVGGYAMTSGIPKDFWDKWLEQNKNLDIVKNRLIMAHGQEESVRDEAKNNAKDVRSGLEPLRMAKDNLDPRLPTRKNREGKDVAAIEVGEKED